MKERQPNNSDRQVTIKRHLQFAKPLSFGVLDIIQPENRKEVKSFNKRYGSLLASF